MGHETRIESYDGKLSKKTVINRFLESTSDECNCDFPRLSQNSFSDCYISGNSPDEVNNKFEEVLSRRYGNSNASISQVEIHDEQKAWNSKSNQKLKEKIQETKKEIKELFLVGLKKVKESKTKKCPSCGAIHPTDKLYSENCPTCSKSIIGKGTDTKVAKLYGKIKVLEEKQKELVLKQKKIKVWLVGIEFHT